MNERFKPYLPVTAALIITMGAYMLQKQERPTSIDFPLTQGQSLDIPPTPTPVPALISADPIIKEAQSLFDFSRKMQNYQRQPKHKDKDQLFQTAREKILRVVAADTYDSYTKISRSGGFPVVISGDTLTTQWGEFNLNSLNDTIYGYATLELMFNNILANKPYPNLSSAHIWGIQMLRSNPGISLEFIGTDGPPIVSPQALSELNTARLLLANQRIAIPRKAEISSAIAIEQEEKGVLRFSQRPYQDLGLYYLNNEPELLQDFKKALATLNQSAGSEVDPTLLGVSNDSYAYTPEQRFIETFAKYFQNGTEFRKRILYAQATDHPIEASLLQAKYDVFKNWSSVEISNNFRPFDTNSFYLDEEVFVADPTRTSKNFGIYLRPEPTLDIDPAWPYVDNCYMARILGERTIVLDHFKKQATLMYRVDAYPEGRSVCENWGVFNHQEASGWIPADYLQPVERKRNP